MSALMWITRALLLALAKSIHILFYYCVQTLCIGLVKILFYLASLANSFASFFQEYMYIKLLNLKRHNYGTGRNTGIFPYWALI